MSSDLCHDPDQTFICKYIIIHTNAVCRSPVDHKGIIPVSGIFGDYPCGNLGIVGIFLIKIVKFLQACELCLVLDQDVILFRKTVDLTFQLFVFLKHVLFITKIVFYISKYIADTGDPLFKGNDKKTGCLLKWCGRGSGGCCSYNAASTEKCHDYQKMFTF